MKLYSLLEQRKATIIDRWFQSVVETYPPETAQFLENQKNKFANPVGAAFFEALGPLFDELLQGTDPDTVVPLLDKVIRIRAVQDFAPSGAIAVVFLLKAVIRDELASEIREEGLSEELFLMESKIDSYALLAFDVYMKCRERVWEVKMNDVMKRPFILTEGGMCPSYLLRRRSKQQEQEAGRGNGNNRSLS